MFDFDGTLADTLPRILAIANRFADVYGYKKVAAEEIPTFREKKTRQAMRELNIPLLMLPHIATRIRQELTREIHLVQPIAGLPRVIEQLRLHYRLGIVTSNSQDNVARFLSAQQIDGFEIIHTGTSLFGKGRVLRHILKQYQLLPAEVMYVGDEMRDVAAALKTGIQMAAVSWGIHTRQMLQQQKPTFLIDVPDELLRLLMPEQQKPAG